MQGNEAYSVDLAVDWKRPHLFNGVDGHEMHGDNLWLCRVDVLIGLGASRASPVANHYTNVAVNSLIFLVGMCHHFRMHRTYMREEAMLSYCWRGCCVGLDAVTSLNIAFSVIPGEQ